MTYNTLLSKSQVDELTKHFTPEMFLGDIRTWNGTLNELYYSGIENAPGSLDIAGFIFKLIGKRYTDYFGYRATIMVDYQSTEKIKNEYPVLQVGIRIWKTKEGKVKSDIIRDGFTNRTRFW